MNPSDAHAHLATLRQLKEMLDAGTLTPQEFEALKQKLVFGSEAVAVPPTEASAPAVAPPSVPASLPPSEPSATARAMEVPEWIAATEPETPASTAPNPLDEANDDERRNPLTLVFIVGGALLLLALVLYLSLGSKSADEHLTSTSQTAADSTTTAPDIGPQTDQITLPPAAPETIRVAPTVPLVAAPAATKFRADSVAPAPTPSVPVKAAPVVAPPKAVVAPVTTDSAKANQP